MAAYWAAVVALGLGIKLLGAASRFFGCPGGPWAARGPAATTRRWLQRNVAMPAAFGYRCAQAVWWGTVPPRAQALAIAVFLALNAGLAVGGYRLTPVNYYFPGRANQVLRYVADRTGVLAASNFPVLWLFGTRNNVALWLTGWDFGTFNAFHRWVARAAALQAVVHALAYTALVWRGACARRPARRPARARLTLRLVRPRGRLGLV